MNMNEWQTTYIFGKICFEGQKSRSNYVGLDKWDVGLINCLIRSERRKYS